MNLSMIRNLFVWILILAGVASSFGKNPPEFPTKISSNKRYLVDQNNIPFFIQSDTPWALFVGLTTEDAEIYLEDRRQKGFNSVTVNLIEHWFNRNKTAYPGSSYNQYGQFPFMNFLSDSIPDFTTPNDKYFAHVDTIIHIALKKRIQVMMTPSYTGYINLKEGWYKEVVANGKERCREYGRYLGKRYADFPNIIWIMDGDRNPDSISKPIIREMVAGIKEFDNKHLITSHCHPSNSSRDHWEGDSWLDLNAVYTYNWMAYVHQRCLENYQRIPVMPCFLFETAYEKEHRYTPAQIRAEMYWGWLCTIAGQQFGNGKIWMFADGWKDELEAVGSWDQLRLKKLVDSRDWPNLVPDYKHEVVTEGFGEKDNYVACAFTVNKETIIIYLPENATPIKVDMTKIGGKKAKCIWYNPQTGESVLIGMFTTMGLKTFEKPDKNDWVLILEYNKTRNYGKNNC